MTTDQIAAAKLITARLAELAPYHIRPYNLGEEGEISTLIWRLNNLINKPDPRDEALEQLNTLEKVANLADNEIVGIVNKGLNK